MNRIVVLLLVGLNLITLATLTVFMVNADSFVEYFDLRLTAIDIRIQDSEVQATADAKHNELLFFDVFDGLTHMHNREIKPMFRALEPLMQYQEGMPPDESHFRPLHEELKEPEARIIITAY